jgi:hypothetical protein
VGGLYEGGLNWEFDVQGGKVRREVERVMGIIESHLETP